MDWDKHHRLLPPFLLRLLYYSFLRLPIRLRRLLGNEDEFVWKLLPGVKGRQTVVQNSQGQKLRVRLDSFGDIVAAFGRQGEKNIPPILNALPRGGIVLDIGAHIGGFSLIAARAVGPSGRVFAFEPVSDNANLLEQNARLNQIDWLVAVRAAVGRKAGIIELLVSDVDTMWASTRVTWADVLHHGTTLGHTTARPVPLITVDDFLREQDIKKVALMKIDVDSGRTGCTGGGGGLACGRVYSANYR